MDEFHQNSAIRQHGWFWGFFLGQTEVPTEPHFSPSRSRLLHFVLWVYVRSDLSRSTAVPTPHLRLTERRSGSLHLAQRFSDLISGGRAKGWGPWPDPPENGVCAKRFYSESGEKGATTGSAALLPDSAMTTQQAPVVMKSVQVVRR